MPKRTSATVREAIMTEDRSKLDLKRSVWNDTGFVNVIKVGNKFQARLQVPGDGRGGTKKRRQHALPGLFDTAEDAAVMLAVIKRGFENDGDGKMHSPPTAAPPALARRDAGTRNHAYRCGSTSGGR